jgi:hypothetical protein
VVQLEAAASLCLAVLLNGSGALALSQHLHLRPKKRTGRYWWQWRVTMEGAKIRYGDLTFKPVSPERWDDLVELFGQHGAYSGCWCI